MFVKKTPELPDEFLREIGLIVVLWGDLEDVLHFVLVGALLGRYPKDDFRAHVVFPHMSFPQKLDALSSMLRMIDDSPDGVSKRYIAELYPLLKECQEKRNMVLHRTWVNRPERITMAQRKARGMYKNEAWTIELEDMQEISTLLRKTTSKLYALSRRLVPRKAPQQGQ